MRPTAAPRTVLDIRTARSVSARAGPGSTPDAYVRLSQLASEKQRLIGEHDLWQRKLERIAKRLREIDLHMDRLHQQVSELDDEQGSRSPGRLRREIELPY